MVEIGNPRAIAFDCNAMAVLGLVVIGYPLAPSSIRAVVLGWIMLAAGITELIFGRHLRTTGRALALRPVPVRSGIRTLPVAVDIQKYLSRGEKS
jgi:hypothetical protein